MLPLVREIIVSSCSPVLGPTLDKMVDNRRASRQDVTQANARDTVEVQN